jgi:hypothetical protein
MLRPLRVVTVKGAQYTMPRKTRKLDCNDNIMDVKKPPQGPEFARFTEAVRDILKISKAELEARIQREKEIKVSASRDSAASAKAH